MSVGGKRMPRRKQGRRVRAPDVTRQKLLEAALEEIYRRGFQAASLDTILARAGVTKGALYHHFPDKAALGYAVVDELVKGLLLQRWLTVLEESSADPLTALQQTLRHRAASLTTEEIELGCPLNNLAQEMSPLDEQFRLRIDATFGAWRDAFARALARGREPGRGVRRGGCRRLLRSSQERREPRHAPLQPRDAGDVPRHPSTGRDG